MMQRDMKNRPDNRPSQYRRDGNKRPGKKPPLPSYRRGPLSWLVIAIIESYQTAHGTVEVPEVLRPYMHGVAELTPPEGGVPFV